MKTTLRPLSHLVVGLILAVLSASSGPLAPRHAHSGAPVSGIPVSLPLSFEANRGQADSQVHYLARGPGYTVFLTDREAVLTLKPGVDNGGPLTSEAGRERSRSDSGAIVRIQPVGPNRHADVQALDQHAGISNYFIGSDPAKWRTGIPTYARVKYEGIYPGVDLVFYGRQRELEFDFVVAPGADPGSIGLAFQGIDDLEVGSQGDLVLKVGGREVWMHKPSVYQVTEDRRQMIPGEYVVKDKNQVGFMLAAYDTSKRLVIDPVLSFSTYLGGADADVGNSIYVDGAGQVYVTGSTQSSGDPPAGFPRTPRAFQVNNGGSTDAFVTKLNDTGTALIYSTYLGGASDDVGNSIFVDGAGNAYVTGSTKSSGDPPAGFPTTPGAFQVTNGGSGTADAFVTKLNAAGTALMYSTYLGGADDDVGNGIFVDGGQAYVTGSTKSSGLATSGAFDETYHGSGDAFVTKLNAAGDDLVYSTYLGGANADVGNSIFVDGTGQAYVTGSTASEAPKPFPTTPGAYQVTNGGSGTADAFVTKLNAAGTALMYSTYLGGADDDVGNGIFVDGGQAYVTGSTKSSGLATSGAFDETYHGSGDAFVTKLNAAGDDLVYSTYLGGANADIGFGIAVNSSGNAYVTGSTASPNFPIVDAIPGSDTGTSTDAFVAKLNPAGNNLVYSTFLGGAGEDVGKSIFVDGAGHAYVTGSTTSDAPNAFPTTSGAFQTTFGGKGDAFVTKIADSAVPPDGNPVSDTGGGGGGCFIATASALEPRK